MRDFTVRHAMLTHPLPAGPSSAGVGFDAVQIVPDRGPQTAWIDTFPVADGRHVVVVGAAPGGKVGATALVAAIRDAFGGERPPAGSSALMLAAAVFGAAATPTVAGLLDGAKQTFTYVSIGGAAPCARYADGSVTLLPAHPACAQGAGSPLEVTLDLHGVDALLVYSAGAGDGSRQEFEQDVLGALSRLPADAERPAAWLCGHVLRDSQRDDVALFAYTFARARFAATALPPSNGGEAPRWRASWSLDTNEFAANLARGAFIACLVSKRARRRPIDLAAAELIFGEMLGNVVRHAPGLVEITLDWTDELPLLHMLDNGPGFASRRLRERLPADDWSENGRGLFLITAMAAAFSVRNRNGRGTHACATLPPA